MKSKKTVSIFVSFICGLQVSLVGAQAAANVRFSTLAVSGQIEGIFYDDASGASVELTAVGYVRSPFFTARADAPLTVYRFLPPKEGGTEPQRQLLGNLQWPEGGGPFLLLINHGADAYSFSITPDDTRSFPFGSFRVLNASKLPVMIQVGETWAHLAPRESTVLKPDLDEEARGALFQVAARVGEEPRVVYSNLWRASQSTRTIVFILDRDNPQAPIGLKRLHESELVLRRKNEPAP